MRIRTLSTTDDATRAALGVIAVGAAYLAGFGWAVGNLPYDHWGALVVLPPLFGVGLVGIRRMFSGDLAPLRRVMYIGLALKLAISGFRYWVAFDAYGGNADAGRYHTYAVDAVARYRAGEVGLQAIIPTGTGTELVEHLTASVYFLCGSSRLAGFVIFSWLAFWGIACFVKAATIALPGLHARPYAICCALSPSLLYWPSSIGKEAVMVLFLGVGTYGIARVLSRDGNLLSSLCIAAVGIGSAAMVRPHIAGVWLAGVFPALIVGVLRGRDPLAPSGNKAVDRVVFSIVFLVASVALVVVGNFALRYFTTEGASFEDAITVVTDETTRRTSQGGSEFTPPAIRGPYDWPFAVVRTLTRPLPFEVRSAFQALTALEMTAFLALCLYSYRRIVRLPRLALTSPYLAFALAVLFGAGLAYASFANLGVLTRQKTLVIPLMMLLPWVSDRRQEPRDSAFQHESDLVGVR